MNNYILKKIVFPLFFLVIFFKGMSQKEVLLTKKDKILYGFSGFFEFKKQDQYESLKQVGLTGGIGFGMSVNKLILSGEFQIGRDDIPIQLFNESYQMYQANFLLGKRIKINNRILLQPNAGLGCFIEHKKNGYTNFKYVTNGTLGFPVSIRAFYLLKKGALGFNFGMNFNSLSIATVYSYTVYYEVNFK